MKTRSSKYLDEDVSTKPRSSRTSKNKYLYSEVNTGIGYDEIDNFSKLDNFDFDSDNSIKTRADYQRVNNKYPIEKEEKKNTDEDDKVYDINSVLETAKKNRNLSDEVEKKRNLQNAEYSILSDLNKKYISKKEKEEMEKEEIKELFDTITSKNLPKDLANADDDDDEKDLMSDLMATNTMNAITNINDVNLEEEIAKEILAEKEEQTQDSDEIKKENGRLVNSFYTKSMDLTEHDFELRDEIMGESKARHKIIILVVLIIIVIIAIVGIFVLKKMNIF